MPLFTGHRPRKGHSEAIRKGSTMTYPLPLGEGRVSTIRHHLALPSFRCFRVSHALTPGPSPTCGRGEFSDSLSVIGKAAGRRAPDLPILKDCPASPFPQSVRRLIEKVLFYRHDGPRTAPRRALRRPKPPAIGQQPLFLPHGPLSAVGPLGRWNLHEIEVPPAPLLRLQSVRLECPVR